MVKAEVTEDFGDLGYGDETRRDGDEVGFPHDYASGGVNAPEPGQAVTLDNDGNVKQYENGDTFLGILVNYARYGDSGGPEDPGEVNPDAPATVRTSGTAKAEVAGADDTAPAVTAMTEVGVDSADGEAGVLDGGNESNPEALALGDAVEDERYDGTQAYFVELLIR